LSTLRTRVGSPCLGPGSLLFGIGNSGRCDDGLGWAFVERLQQQPAYAGRLECRYQLQVEDAALVSRADRVLFVDSHRGALPGGFQMKPCAPARKFEFSTHALSPSTVLYLCGELYGKAPPADLLLIEGLCWDLRTGLSGEAQLNLNEALGFFGVTGTA
jgi:hydrogenase maturation protease